jgi:hypothetical protein
MRLAQQRADALGEQRLAVAGEDERADRAHRRTRSCTTPATRPAPLAPS